jgi:hypothetical protein
MTPWTLLDSTQVFADDILFEKSVSASVRCGGQSNEVGIEILNHLTPQIVNGTVAFIDHNKIKKLDGDLWAVDDGHRHFPLASLRVSVIA